jgi:thioredoxin reductase
MTKPVDVVVVGAGPYGLSVAAHLRERGADVRVFGAPMQTWRQSMPVGMSLKSEGFASNLSDPGRTLTLGAYCAQHNIPYADTGIPVPVNVFAAYGKAFQERFIPDLVQKKVMSIGPASHGFDLRTEDDDIVAARRVVVASGIRSYDYIPPELQGLPRQYLSHSVEYGDAAHLAGLDVLVVGAGSSATDMAAHLRLRGANTRIVTRRKAITFQSQLGERSLLEKIKAPMTGLGPGWKSVLCVRAPLLFHVLPEAFRIDVVRRYLGPAPAWFVRSEVEGHVPYTLQSQIMGSEVVGDRVSLVLRGPDGTGHRVTGNHIVAATGYRVDVDRLTFLDPGIRNGLRLAGRAPALSNHFESSMPGLYFVGTAAANSFGPMLRFVYGADFAARRLAGHLALQLRRRSVMETRHGGAQVSAEPTA